MVSWLIFYDFPPGLLSLFTALISLSLCQRWFAKRFLHPDIVAPYDYIFVWDEDLGVDNFNAEKSVLPISSYDFWAIYGNFIILILLLNSRYIDLVKKYRLEISQPGLEPNSALTWRMTKRRNDSEVHK